MFDSNDLPPDSDTAFYVGDDDYDLYVPWLSVWVPSPEDEGIKNFVLKGKKERKGCVNFKRLVKHLKKIAPHIRWRISIDGSDEYTTGNWQWEAIAVPDDQTGNAEHIIRIIEKRGDISKFRNPKDLFPFLYDKKGKLHTEAADFAKAFHDLWGFVCADYSQYWDAPKIQIELLIMFLANLYASGTRLVFLKVDSDFNDRWMDGNYENIERQFSDEMWSRYIRYFGEEYGDKEAVFESIAEFCYELDQVNEEFRSNVPHLVAQAIKYWQWWFKHSTTTILDVLQCLNLIQHRIGEPQYESISEPDEFDLTPSNDRFL